MCHISVGSLHPRFKSEMVSPMDVAVEQTPEERQKGNADVNQHKASALTGSTNANVGAARVRHVSVMSNGDTTTSLETDGNGSTVHDTYRKFDTANLKTFGQNTHEAIPQLDFYRQTTNAPQYKRPTLDELHEEKVNYILDEFPNNFSYCLVFVCILAAYTRLISCVLRFVLIFKLHCFSHFIR